MKKLILILMLLLCVGIAYAKPVPENVDTDCNKYILMINNTVDHAILRGEADICGKGLFDAFSDDDADTKAGILYHPDINGGCVTHDIPFS